VKVAVKEAVPAAGVQARLALDVIPCEVVSAPVATIWPVWFRTVTVPLGASDTAACGYLGEERRRAADADLVRGVKRGRRGHRRNADRGGSRLGGQPGRGDRPLAGGRWRPRKGRETLGVDGGLSRIGRKSRCRECQCDDLVELGAGRLHDDLLRHAYLAVWRRDERGVRRDRCGGHRRRTEEQSEGSQGGNQNSGEGHNRTHFRHIGPRNVSVAAGVWQAT
jgi:hypothetical protein